MKFKSYRVKKEHIFHNENLTKEEMVYKAHEEGFAFFKHQNTYYHIHVHKTKTKENIVVEYVEVDIVEDI